MKKVVLILILMFSFVGTVCAEDEILVKKTEVAELEIEGAWHGTNRKIYELSDMFLVYDRYVTVPPKGFYEPVWHFDFTTYDKNWNKLKTSTIKEKKFLVGNNYLYSWNDIEISDGYHYEIKRYDENFNTINLSFDYKKFCDIKRVEGKPYHPYCFISLLDVYSDSNNVYFLVHNLNSYYDVLEVKVLKISNDFKEYEFLDINELDIKKNFPKYYYQFIIDKNKIGNEYYLKDDKVLISGETLRYYENDEKRFEVTNDDYVRFGSAKVYNNLIIAIGYINYTEESYSSSGNKTEMHGLNNSDILFYDLDGNLIGTYEHNYYDYDMMLVGDNLVISNLYVDGICEVDKVGYYKYNSNCKATLMNEIYSMKEDYLGLSKSASITGDDKKEEIKNPETLPSVNKVILLSFIALIILIATKLFKSNVRKI